MKLARRSLIAVGIVSIIIAVIGICRNLAMLFLNILLATQASNNLCSRPVFFVASAISTVCYLVLLGCGVQFVRLRTGLTVFGFFAGVIVCEFVLFLFSGFMAPLSGAGINIHLAYSMAMSGMMFQVYILFPLWAPCLAWWAARKIERDRTTFGQPTVVTIVTPESSPAVLRSDDAIIDHVNCLWRRVLALVIDVAVILIIGRVLGTFFGPRFSSMESHEGLVGAAVIIIYFWLLNSKLSNGQTPGKWLLRIRVVTATGMPPSILRAFLRIIVLFIPLFVICDGVEAIRPEWYRYYYFAITTIFMGGLGTIVYLALFNYTTRQSLHDIICGTYIVRTKGIPCIPTRRPWRGHWVIVGGVVLASAVISFAVSSIMPVGPAQRDIENIERAIKNNSNYNSVLAYRPFPPAALPNTGSGGAINRNSNDIMMVNVTVQQPPSDYAKEAARIAQIVLDKYPDARDIYTIDIYVSHGYDIGIYSSWYTWHESKTPDEWTEVGAN